MARVTTPATPIAMITHETPGDTFWDKIKSGAQQAADNYGIDLKYSNDPDPGQHATLIQNAVDSKVDGIATTLDAPTRRPTRSRPPWTPGSRSWPSTRASTSTRTSAPLMYFGSDETLAGETAGAADHRGRRAAPALRDPGRGVGGARGAVCRREGQGAGHREHPGQRCGRLRGRLLAAGQAVRGRLDRLHRHPRRADRAGRAPGDGRRGQRREAGHLRPQRRRGPGHQGRRRSSSRSTSSPTSRATWRSRRCT